MKMRGFTIVELLIVIVVIAILAAITIVTYNGIQARANATRVLTDLRTLNDAILMYHADNGRYPPATGWNNHSNSSPTNYVPGLVPDYLSALPTSLYSASGGDNRNSYYYLGNANGTEYKIFAHDGEYRRMCTNEIREQFPERVDPGRVRADGSACWGFGYWSENARMR